jgi:VanZ family protein
MNEQKPRGGRLWRYVPVVLWMAVIFAASTSALSGDNTSRLIGPILHWLFPNFSEAKIEVAHFVVRKAAHFAEYAVLAFLAARAFATSKRVTLRRRFFYVTLFLIVVYSLSDELHQNFVPTRTGSIYDSFIDIAGGLTALTIYTLLRRRSQGRGNGVRDESAVIGT